MKTLLLEYINKNKEVTVAAIWRDIQEFKGESNWITESNLIIWSGCSESGIDALIDLFISEEVFFKEVSAFLYLLEGLMLDYPTANTGRFPYTSPHWLPITVISKDECIRQGRMEYYQELKAQLRPKNE